MAVRTKKRNRIGTNYCHACITVGKRYAAAPMGTVNDVLGSPQTRFASGLVLVAPRSAILPHQLEVLARGGDSNNKRATDSACKGETRRKEGRSVGQSCPHLGCSHGGTVVLEYWYRQVLN